MNEVQAFIFMVRSARFERATPCLGGRCSIQLSYDRRQRVYSSRRRSNMQGIYEAAERSGRLQDALLLEDPGDIFLRTGNEDGGIRSEYRLCGEVERDAAGRFHAENV